MTDKINESYFGASRNFGSPETLVAAVNSVLMGQQEQAMDEMRKKKGKGEEVDCAPEDKSPVPKDVKESQDALKSEVKKLYDRLHNEQDPVKKKSIRGEIAHMKGAMTGVTKRPNEE